MDSLTRLFQKIPANTVISAAPSPQVEPRYFNEPIPNALNLGWHWSENKQEFQMLKIARNDRATHMFCIGASGSGKTRFMEFLIQQDIEAGNGFGVISPHSDLITDIKGFLACSYENLDDKSILDRVIVIDPSDPTETVVFNLLEASSGVSAAKQAEELITVFKRIWSASWGPRMEDLLRNSLIALGEAGMTLGDLPQFLTSQKLRTQVLSKVENPIAKAYFDRWNSLTDRARLNWAEPILNKIDAFLANDRIRVMLSHPKSTFNLRAILDNKKILLVNSDKGALGDESSNLLNALLLAKIQMSIFSRSDTPESQRVPWFLYIDEFQNFVSDSFATILSEARKYRLSLIMANQSLAQIPADLRSIILGNTGVQVYFRVARRDAEVLSKESFTYSGYQAKTVSVSGGTRYWSLGEEWERNFSRIMNQRPRHCFIKNMIEGGMLALQTIQIDPAWEVLGISEEEYPAYLANLPFGSKYLVKRSSLALQAGQTETTRDGIMQSKLEAQEHSFLEFIVDNPDSAVSVVYRGLGLSWRKGNEIRDSLIEQDLIVEIETRMGKAGRRTKCFIPTFEALEILGKEPSPGRGGTVHRHIQHLVQEGGIAKGYLVQCEKELANGGIVDVHMEQGEQRIAVEVAVISKPEREIAHITNCLRAEYDRVICIFADERLMERTKEATSITFTKSELEKVTLMHLSKLSTLV